MARGINKVILIGNLGNDPEIRATQQGNVVATLSIATDESYKDKQTGQIVPKTEWHRVVMFSRLGEIARDYLHKGAKVYIEGRLQTRKWQGQDGQDRYTTEIVANEMQMLDSRSAGAQQNIPPAQGSYSSPNQNHSEPSSPMPQQSAAPVAADFDDDIPF